MEESKNAALVMTNCITEERDQVKSGAILAVQARHEWEKGRKFERIPILRGFILKEIKQ